MYHGKNLQLYLPLCVRACMHMCDIQKTQVEGHRFKIIKHCGSDKSWNDESDFCLMSMI